MVVGSHGRLFCVVQGRCGSENGNGQRVKTKR
jgi:hypothetical protein